MPEKMLSASKRLMPKWLFYTLLLFVFLVSLLYHLPSGVVLKPLNEALQTNKQGLVLDGFQGSLWQGQTTLQWQEPTTQQSIALGNIAWQLAPLDLLTGAEPDLDWQSTYGEWQGKIFQSWNSQTTRIQTSNLRLELQAAINEFASLVKVPVEIKGTIVSNQLNLTVSPTQGIQHLKGMIRFENLAAMGVAMPTTYLRLSMVEKPVKQANQNAQAPAVLWQIDAKEANWKMSGKGSIYLNPQEANFGQYQGEIKVDAVSEDDLPDFAHLMRQTAPNQAILRVQGKLKGI